MLSFTESSQGCFTEMFRKLMILNASSIYALKNIYYN